MVEVLDLILKTTITALAGTFAGAVVIWIKSMVKKGKVYDAAMKALAHDSFYRQCREILAHDTMSEDELENLNYLHEAYKSLGLNGTGEELYKRCLEKKIE